MCTLAKPMSTPTPRAKIVALIVEDDPTLLDLVTETVESLGHEVRMASSQEEALKELPKLEHRTPIGSRVQSRRLSRRFHDPWR